jgi:hypothetical protein
VAVGVGHDPITTFEQWYTVYEVDQRDGTLGRVTVAPCGNRLWTEYDRYKREMDLRVHEYEKLEMLVDAEVISKKPDLPNVSSGETAGMIRRIARNLVQNTPNVEVVSKFDDDRVKGIFAKHILTSKVIGSDNYSNDMQQNLFASTKSSLTLGFDCVIPALLQDAAGGWYMHYDSIHYRDVFPDPGCKDIRQATDAYVRRYLTKGEVMQLIRDQAPGWDVAALKTMVQQRPGSREQQSVDYQTKKRHIIPEGYEIITWYSNTGHPFLTFSPKTRALLRIEKNKHPLKQHPVHFLVLEKDDQQPLGKSQVELLIGRQEFQDLMLNGAMKLWYRNINPSIIGYGTVNSIPNLSPGKYTQISNPNAKVEAFEVNTQTLLQYGQISEQNLGSMVSMIGAADQQMATQSGNGMSATPQGVEAQQQMVDITTNNYQKAIESFVSHYCSYALTIYFAELAAVKKVAPTAEARINLMKAGLEPYSEGEDGEALGDFNKDGTLDIDFQDMVTEYFVRVVPGSLVELEDEKQIRLLNQMFVPLSQAMPALAGTGDPEILQNMAQVMSYIVKKQIELSGSNDADTISKLWSGRSEEVDEKDSKIAQFEETLNGVATEVAEAQQIHADAILMMQEQMALMRESQGLLLEKLGVTKPGSTPSSPEPGSVPPGSPGQTSSLSPASA